MLKSIFQVLATATLFLIPLSASADHASLISGGTFIRNQSQDPNRLADINSAIVVDIPCIDLCKIGKPQYVNGNILLTTLAVGVPSSQFISNFEVKQIVLLYFNKCNGDYELVLSGVKNRSEIIFTDRTTSDGVIDHLTVDVTNDNIVGRLKKENGVVTRSDWSTGYENCVGFGQPLLTLNDGQPVAEGDNTTEEYYLCAEQYALGEITPMPTASSFAPGQPNYGKLPTDRSLGGDILFHNDRK